MFRVGQKVVCIDGCPWPMAPLIKGNIYTIRDVGHFGSSLHVDVDEAFSNFAPRLQWRAERFRPIVDKKDEISFTTGAPKDSEKWDNRRKVKVRA